jgi:outer membrane murein-binding lipoprotein Lpp
VADTSTRGPTNLAGTHRPSRAVRIVSVVAAMVLATTALAGCGRVRSRLQRAATSTVAPAAGVTALQIDPTDTNPALTEPAGPDLVDLDSAVPSNRELFVLFPGTGGQPDCCQLLLQEAARLGFHALGLAYQNTKAVGEICLNDLSCYGTVRQNDFNGSDPSAFSDVSPDQSISARLVDLLGYLSRKYPSEGWSSFVSGSQVTWGTTVVAGHSQGGGDAAYIAKVVRTEGVVLLSSVVDSTSTSPPRAATYLTTGHLTPLSRYVGFDHTRDPFYPKIRADWTALGLDALGQATSVDRGSPPYLGSHELVTSTAVPDVVLATHDSTAVDSATPICPNGEPQFAPVWRYMMQVAGGLPITQSASAAGATSSQCGS